MTGASVKGASRVPRHVRPFITRWYWKPCGTHHGWYTYRVFEFNMAYANTSSRACNLESVIDRFKVLRYCSHIHTHIYVQPHRHGRSSAPARDQNVNFHLNRRWIGSLVPACARHVARLNVRQAHINVVIKASACNRVVYLVIKVRFSVLDVC